MRIAFAVVLAFAVPAFSADAFPEPIEFPAGVDQVTLKLQRADTLLLAPVKINGHDAGLFLVDTGASEVTISHETAKTLRLTSVSSNERVRAVGGRSALQVCPVDSLDIGGVTIRRTFVGAIDMLN